MCRNSRDYFARFLVATRSRSVTFSSVGDTNVRVGARRTTSGLFATVSRRPTRDRIRVHLTLLLQIYQRACVHVSVDLSMCVCIGVDAYKLKSTILWGMGVPLASHGELQCTVGPEEPKNILNFKNMLQIWLNLMEF